MVSFSATKIKHSNKYPQVAPDNRIDLQINQKQ
jgi:hypothetical protein